MNFECEKLSTKFYKYILGVHKRATNLAVNGDLGRTPYFIDIICTILKYLKRSRLGGGHNKIKESYCRRNLQTPKQQYRLF